MSTGDHHPPNDLATILAHLDGRFDLMTMQMNQLQTEMSLMKAQMGQMKTEMMTEMGQLNRRMDDFAGVELGRQMQQNPVDGGNGGQVNQEQVDGAINNAGDGALDGQENEDDNQDSASVKSEIDSGSCQSEFDRWLNGEEDIEVKEEVDEDSGTGGQQQSEDQALFQPVAGPSGMCRSAQKRPQANPPHRSNRQAASSQRRLNLSESSDTEEDDTDWEPAPLAKKARTTSDRWHKPRRCPHCSKMFTRLAYHLPTHTGERPHVCDQCSKAFALKFHLTAHRRIHTGERPFVCQQVNCGRAFTKKCNLDDHLLRRHLGEKRHRCEQCGKRFVARGELVQHHRHVHSNERPYRCLHSGCDYATARKCDLDRHLKSKKHRDQEDV